MNVSNIISIGQPLRVEEVVNPENIGSLIGIASTARLAEIAGRILVSGQANTQALGHLRFLCVVDVGFALKNIYETVKTSVINSTKEKIDALLGVIANLATIIYSVETFGHGLDFVGAIKSVAWTPPFLITGGVLQTIGMTLEIRKYRDADKICKELHRQANLSKSVGEYTFDDFRQGCDYLLDQRDLDSNFGEKDSDFISKNFYKNEAKVFNKLMQVQSEVEVQMDSGKTAEMEKGRKSMHEVMQALSKRITVKKWSHALEVLINVISLVGVVIFFTPIAPVGYGLWVLCGIMSLTGKAIAYGMQRQFEKAVLKMV